MKIDTTVGRVIGETEEFVDVEFDGYDVRSVLTTHAYVSLDVLTEEERVKIASVVALLLRPNLLGKRFTARIAKNIYAAANEKPEKTE